MHIDACDSVIFEVFTLFSVNTMKFLCIFVINKYITSRSTNYNRKFAQCDTSRFNTFTLPLSKLLSQISHSLGSGQHSLNKKLRLSLLLCQNFCGLHCYCLRILQFSLCITLIGIFTNVNNLECVFDFCIAFWL